MKTVWTTIKDFRENVDKGHMKAYAASAAFFLVISLVPCILLMLTLIQYTPVSQSFILETALEVFPSNINVMIATIVTEVYNKSTSAISITAIIALWSGGKGVLSITSGLNWVYGSDETRGYIYLRIRSAIYTLVFVVAIVMTLLLLVFGNSIAIFVIRYLPILEPVMQLIIDLRVLVSLAILIVVFMIIYKFLPDMKVRIRNQLPGAAFAAVGWLACSFAFSVYVDFNSGFANMYGSLTTIVLIMLWLYFCMYIVLIGAKINVYFYEEILGK